MSLSGEAMNARKQRYKVTVDRIGARSKREENMVEIRNCRREETLMKKRRETVASAPNIQPSSVYDQTISLDENLPTLPAIVSALASDDIQAKEAAAIHLRRMLSIVSNPPIDAVIESGAVPHLVDILRRSDMNAMPDLQVRCNLGVDILRRSDMNAMSDLQFEAAWALTNIVSGTSEHTKVVIDNGALPIFVNLLYTGKKKIIEQVIWALGNIIGDSPANRDLAIAYGHGEITKLLLGRINFDHKISFIRMTAWTISNICRDKPQLRFDQLKDVFSALQELVLYIRDDEALGDACWSLSDLSDGSNFDGSNWVIQRIIDVGMCRKLVKLLSSSSPLLVIPALRTVGNIVTGDEVQTQVVIDQHALPRILKLLTAEDTKKDIVREACWTISNITAGTIKQIQAVIDAKIFPPLLWLLANAEFIIKKEAVWAVANATSGGTDKQIKYLTIQGCIKPLCDLLACPDPTIITVCLEGLENILTVGEAEKNANLTDVNVYVNEIEDADGLDKIEDLQSHENKEVYEKAIKILVNYFAETAFHISTDKQPEVPPGGFNFM